MLEMRFAKIWWTDFGCSLRFHDGGKELSAWPHHTSDYNLISHRCGYGYDVLRYCREHEFAHLFVEQELYERPSRVLKALSLGSMLGCEEASYEEMMAQQFQRFLRAGERPMISGVQWDRLKHEALCMLDKIEIVKGTEAA
jgi:hypothetical protein